MSGPVLIPPVSKSDAHRALVISSILGLKEPLPDEALPADVSVLREGLAVLARGGSEIECHDAGAPFRFLLAQAAVTPQARVKLFGTPRLAERPHAALFEGKLVKIDGLGQQVIEIGVGELHAIGHHHQFTRH